MHRLMIASVCALVVGVVHAQTATPGSSDPLALSLAQQAANALTHGLPISDVKLSANVISIYGSDSESGTATLRAKGFGQSRVDLQLSGGTRSNVRDLSGTTATGAWQNNGAAAVAYAYHNCQTDAGWFFPALSALSQSTTGNYLYRYIGQVQHGGVNTQHLQVIHLNPTDPIAERLSTTDFYLDPVTSLPVAIAFQTHPDLDGLTNIPVEIGFASWQAVSGIQVPFHIQKMFNGGVVEDYTVTNVTFNTGLLSSVFSLQ